MQYNTFDEQNTEYDNYDSQSNVFNKNNIVDNNLKEFPYMQLKDIIKLPRKIKRSREVIFNISDVQQQYDVIRNVASQILSWQLVYAPVNYKSDWFIIWIDGYITEDDLKKMYPYQKINHFPLSYHLCRKNLLSQNLTKMQNIFPNDYNFSPKTWLLPQQYDEFKKYTLKLKKNYFFICKPEGQCQGKGIFLTSKCDGISHNDHVIIQQYIANPMLIDDLKFDFRIYVLVKNLNPLKIFMYPEGLARFSTQKYQQPTNFNMTNLCMHLTNYAINKKSPDFKFNESIEKDNIGHKRSLTSVFKYIYEQGYDVEKIFMEIRRIIIKTIISAQPYMLNSLRATQPNYKLTEFCFEILGFDILLDENLKPWLIEVNHSPSFTTDSPLDQEIKKHLILDTFNLINVSYKEKQKFQKSVKKSQPIDLHKSNPPIYYLPSTNKKNESEMEQKLTDIHEYEELHKGAFFRIFPNPDDNPKEYLKYFEISKKESKEFANKMNKKDKLIDIEHEIQLLQKSYIYQKLKSRDNYMNNLQKEQNDNPEIIEKQEPKLNTFQTQQSINIKKVSSGVELLKNIKINVYNNKNQGKVYLRTDSGDYSRKINQSIASSIDKISSQRRPNSQQDGRKIQIQYFNYSQKKVQQNNNKKNQQ